jgi:hypothetical protein
VFEGGMGLPYPFRPHESALPKDANSRKSLESFTGLLLLHESFSPLDQEGVDVALAVYGPRPLTWGHTVLLPTGIFLSTRRVARCDSDGPRQNQSDQLKGGLARRLIGVHVCNV